jgi:hypothetical protein
MLDTECVLLKCYKTGDKADYDVKERTKEKWSSKQLFCRTVRTFDYALWARRSNEINVFWRVATFKLPEPIWYSSDTQNFIMLYPFSNPIYVSKLFQN